MSEDNLQEKEIPIREAKPTDCEQIIIMIQELIDYQEMTTGTRLTADILRKDGFGDEKVFHCFVADDISRLVGYALYFFDYSSLGGVGIYLEDIYVAPSYRHKSIGTRLLRAVAKVAVDRNIDRLKWVCLDCNKSAVDFYMKKGSVNLTSDEGWNLFKLSGDELKAFAK